MGFCCCRVGTTSTGAGLSLSALVVRVAKNASEQARRAKKRVTSTALRFSLVFIFSPLSVDGSRHFKPVGAVVGQGNGIIGRGDEVARQFQVAPIGECQNAVKDDRDRCPSLDSGGGDRGDVG